MLWFIPNLENCHNLNGLNLGIPIPSFTFPWRIYSYNCIQEITNRRTGLVKRNSFNSC